MACTSLSFQIIREDIAPEVQKVDAFEFVGGEKRCLAIQVLNRYNSKPHMVPLTGWMGMLTLPTSDSQVQLNFEAVFDSLDRSIFIASLSTEDTQSLISGKMKVSLIESGDSNATTVVGSFDPGTYTASTGEITVLDVVDLSTVAAGDIFIDASSASFLVLSASNVTGAKKLVIGKNKTVNVGAGALVKRSTNVLIAIRESIFTKTKP